MLFSIIIPIYNRPEELDELLNSLSLQEDAGKMEIIVVEDGSLHTSQHIVEKYQPQLDIQYFFKPNSGPGDSRNYGMQRAKGDYFVILDSDTIVPKDYIKTVRKRLSESFVDAYGGPDMSAPDFSNIQKAITYAMTSMLTTGGIRGKKQKVGKFQPRSFNMGISRKAFEKTGGFAPMRVGEDIDLSITLWENGFQTELFQDVGVYHKRRSTLESFSKQVYQFGTARPILFHRHPNYKSWIFWFPSIFLLGTLAAWIGFFSSFCIQVEFIKILFRIPMAFWLLYSLMNFIFSFIQFKSVMVGLLSIITSCIQLCSYGLGFLQSFILIQGMCVLPEDAFPSYFSKKI